MKLKQYYFSGKKTNLLNKLASLGPFLAKWLITFF